MSYLRDQLQSSLSGAYTLDRELGGGGMSRVFVAEETRLGRKVVVKVLSPELAAALSNERFEREIRLAASLQQANIVPVLTAGETGGLPYYTMPFVEGESLRARLAREETALPIGEVLGILKDVGRALAYAHQHGVVHRDIKPDNVLLSGGAAVVTDFGIAKAIAAARTSGGAATLTQVGTSIGTPAYMAPEQAAGDEVDHRADIYALGCLAYELLTGRVPFHGRTAQRMLAAHMSEVPQPVSDVRADCPAGLTSLVMRCLEKDPTLRPQTAAEVVQDVDSVATSGATGAAAMVLLQPRVSLAKALAYWAAAAIAIPVVAKAAVIAIGLPDWVFPGSIVVIVLGLPVILATHFVQRTARKALMTTPTLTPGGSPTHGTMANVAMRASPHMTWKRTGYGGAVAVGTFALIVAGFMTLRALGIGPAGSLFAAGTLNERDRILVADFRVPSADSSLGTVIAEAVRTNLAQSRAVGIVSMSAIGDALRRMQRPPTSRIDLPLARELAEREGIKAVVHGDLTPVGTGFLLTVRLVGASSGDELASFREAARDATDLIPAIDRVTRDLRGKIGESLKAVRRSPDLVRVTTASLPALRKYTEGMALHYRDLNYTAAAAAFEEAIRLDSTFAMSYMRAANSYVQASQNVARADSLRAQAFRMRTRLPDLERALVEGAYYGSRGSRDSIVAAYERALALDSAQSVVLNILGNTYGGMRQYARAELAYRRAMALNDGNRQPGTNLVSVLVNQGKFDEAQARIDSGLQQRGPDATLLARGAAIQLMQGRYDSASRLLDVAGRIPRNMIARAARNYLADLQVTRGRLSAAQQARARLLAEDLVTGNVESREVAQALVALDSVHTDSWVRERPAAALPRLDRIAARIPTSLEAGWPVLVLQVGAEYARLGRPDRARAMVSHFERAPRDSGSIGTAHYWKNVVVAEIAISERRYADAISAIRTSDLLEDGRPHFCESCTAVMLARTFDLAGMPDSAIVSFERYITIPHVFRWFIDSDYLAGAHKRLGELYEAKGDRQKALGNYLKFVDLWKDADPELQPRVREVRARIERLRDTEGR